MNDVNYKAIVAKYTWKGGLIGLGFTFIAFIVEVIICKSDLSFEAIAQIHYLCPIFWVIDLFPIAGCIVGYFLGQFVRNCDLKKKELTDAEYQKNKKILIFLKRLIEGELETEYKLQDTKDILGKSLLDLRDNLIEKREIEKQRRKEDENRNWVAEGLAKFGDILRKFNNGIEELSYELISNLVKYLKANQGGFYLLNEDNPSEKYFDMTACFAYDRRKFADKRIAWAEGLVGTCALEKKTIFMTDVPDNYLRITSGLGEANPRCLLLVPMIVNDELCGVIEIASFQKLEPFQIEFVENVAENIASSITNIKISLRTSRLLKESQEQSDALVSKEEQLRQNMEELQAAQEEANRQAEKFVNFTNSVNHTMIRAEFMPDGSLIYANTRFLNKLGYMNNSDVEGKNISMFINEKDKAWFFNIWDDLSKGGKHFEGDMKFVTRQRQDLWTMATFTCIRRSDNSVERILFLAIDTTDQKKQSLDYEGQIDALNRSTIKAEFTPEGEFLGGNQNFLKTLEYSQEQANEKTVFDFISVLEVNKFKKSWESVVNGEAFQGQFQINTSSNAHKWFNGTYSAVRNMYNEVDKIVFIGYDATKEKLMEIETAAQTEQLKLQEEQLRSAQEDLSKKLEKARYEMQLQYKEVEKVKIRNERTLEGALDAILTINQFGTIEFFNQAAENLWEIDRQDVLGKNVKVLFSEEAVKTDEFVNSFVRQGENKIVGQRREVNIRNSAGQEKPVLFLLSEAKLDHEHSYTAFVQNIEVELF